MIALENLYAKGSGLKDVTFKDLNFKNLELPATTQTLNGTRVFSTITLSNVTWENMSFWTTIL